MQRQIKQGRDKDRGTKITNRQTDRWTDKGFCQTWSDSERQRAKIHRTIEVLLVTLQLKQKVNVLFNFKVEAIGQNSRG